MEETQQEYIKFQMLDQQIKNTQKQLQMMEQQLVQLASAHEAVLNLASTKTGTEMFVQVSDGIFAKSELKDNKKLILNVGAKTCVTKDIPSTVNLITSQIDQLRMVQNQLVSELQKMTIKAQELGEKLKNMGT